MVKVASRRPTSVSEYIQAAPKNAQAKLRQMRAAVKAAAPKATESLKWSMPAYSYDRILVTYAAFTNHIGFYPTPSAVREFKKDLEKYKTAAGSIQFPLTQALPTTLIKKITAFRSRELKEKDVKWMG